jgi:polyhydroxybutyrate depolymerase
MPILHLHGTRDLLVPWDGPVPGQSLKMPFLSVPETLKIWIAANHCTAEPVVTDVPDKADDGTQVVRRTYLPSAEGAEIVVYAIEGGGHTWPGSPNPQLEFLGKTTLDISANDVIWDFFVRHPRRAP